MYNGTTQIWGERKLVHVLFDPVSVQIDIGVDLSGAYRTDITINPGEDTNVFAINYQWATAVTL